MKQEFSLVDGLRANLAAAEAAAAVTATTLNVGATKSAYMVTLPRPSWRTPEAHRLATTMAARTGDTDAPDGGEDITLQHRHIPEVTEYSLLGVWDDAAKGVAWLSDLHRRKKRNGWNGIKYAYLRSNISVHSITVAVARWKQLHTVVLDVTHVSCGATAATTRTWW